MMLKEKTENADIGIISDIILFLISSIRYSLLPGLIIPLVAILIFDLMLIKPDFSFEFFKYLAFIDPVYKTGSFNLGVNDVMRIFAVFSLFVGIVGSLTETIIRKVLKKDIITSPLNKNILFLLGVISIYAGSAIFFLFKLGLTPGYYIFLFVTFVAQSVFLIQYMFLTELEYRFKKHFRR